MKLKYTLGLSIDRWAWLVTSSAWLLVFVQNFFCYVKYTLVKWSRWWRHQSLPPLKFFHRSKWYEMVQSWNIHWGYRLTEEDDLWHHQLDHLCLFQNFSWHINYTLVKWSRWWRHLYLLSFQVPMSYFMSKRWYTGEREVYLKNALREKYQVYLLDILFFAKRRGR